MSLFSLYSLSAQHFHRVHCRLQVSPSSCCCSPMTWLARFLAALSFGATKTAPSDAEKFVIMQLPCVLS